MEIELKERVKSIVTHTVEDFYLNLGSAKDGKKSLIKSLTVDLLSHRDIEDLTVIEISLLVLKKLGSTDLIDIEFIMENITEDKSYCKSSDIEVPKF